MALTKKVLLLLALLAVAAITFMYFVASSSGGAGRSRSTTPGEITAGGLYPRATLSRVATRTRIRYLEENGVVQPGQDNGFSFKCPRRTPNAVSSYFYAVRKEAQGKVVLAGSFPYGKSTRNWAVGVANLGSQPEEFVVGVLCLS